MVLRGGCQCGAVRFACQVDRSSAHICHCRMCQKAGGNFYAALVGVTPGTLAWTKTEPKRFRSSSQASRGFCPECGTPLTYEGPDGIALSIGAFDRPENLPPLQQHGTEGRLRFVNDLHTLPETQTADDATEQPFLKEIVSFQHPDEPASER